MRASKTLKLSGALLALGSLLFIIPAQAGAEGSSGGGNAACIMGCKESPEIDSYLWHGYAYGISDPPAQGAELFHVKLRGHSDELEFKAFNAKGETVSDWP